MYVSQPSQPGLHRSPYVRVRVYRVDDLHIFPPCQPLDGFADPLEARPEALPAVCRHHNQLPLRVRLHPVETGQLACLQPVPHVQYRVNSGVAGHQDVALRHPLGPQVLGRPLGRREVQRRQLRRQHPVQLFRERLQHIARAQPRLHVPYGNLGIECRQRPAERGRRVSLHQDHVRSLLADHRFQRRHNPRRRLRQALVRPHDVQIMVRPDPEHLQHLVQHLPVLRGHTNAYLELARPPLHVQHNRT